MRVPDANLAEVWDQGFTIVEGFVYKKTLAAARAALWKMYPKPKAYFADPAAYPDFARSQFAGLRFFPYPAWDLNRLAVYPDLVDAAERFLGGDDLDIYKIEVWAKYAGAVDYDQQPHRDYNNHTIVVPRADGLHTQMTTFILLSDVTEADSPTKVLPSPVTRDIPIGNRLLPMGSLKEKEVSAVGPAGSLLIYKTDVFHRGSDFTVPDRSRFVMLVDFKRRGLPWQGKLAWPNQAPQKGWNEAMIRMTPRERDLFGWPPIGSDYWNAQTLSDVALRYPGIDLTPYGA